MGERAVALTGGRRGTWKSMATNQHAEAQSRIHSVRAVQLDLYKELKLFKTQNNLERIPKYPTSVVFHFSIIVMVVILESLANMYLFAQGNDLGLLGGIFEAFLISVANVGVSVVIGYIALPQIHHIDGRRRAMGYLGLIVAIVFACVFNLVAAHYRDLLVESKAEALLDALPSAFADPFDLTFNGLVLLALGLVVSGLGLWKGYSADDPYPGYGPLARRYEDAKREFLELRSQHPKIRYELPGTED